MIYMVYLGGEKMYWARGLVVNEKDEYGRCR